MVYLITKFFQLCGSKTGAWAMLALVLVQACFLIGAGQPELDPERARAADDAVEQMAAALAHHAGNRWAGKYVKVARLATDHNDAVRDRLEAAVQARTNCRLVKDTVFTSMYDAALAKAARLGVLSAPCADAWKTQPPADLDEALAVARDAQTGYLVFGSVEEFRRDNDGAQLRLRIRAADAASARCVFDETVRVKTPRAVFANCAGNKGAPKGIGVGVRIAGWLLFVVLLPLTTAFLWQTLLGHESNLVNALCLVALAGTATLAGWAMLRFGLPSVMEALVLLAAFVLAAAWDLYVLGLLEKRRVKLKYQM